MRLSLKSCVGLNIENMVSDMAISLKFNIVHGRIAETNKDIEVEFDFVLHKGHIYCNDTIQVMCMDNESASNSLQT